MEFDVVTKLIFGIISALGTMAVIFLNARQAEKVKSELLEKLEVALEKSQKHSVTELFRLIHGVRMSYSDIVELVKHDECIKIIYAIRKTPGIVRYESGAFTYTKMGGNPIFRFIDRWFTRFGIAFFGALSVASLLMLGLSDGVAAAIGFVFMIFNASMLAVQVRQHRYDKMVSNLIYPEHNKSSNSDSQKAAVS